MTDGASAQQLRFLLTNVLAIPMAQELPTINARKTCALAVWLIQTMQLPAEVVEPAAPRIAYAIRRGIEGELGREGKKGAVNDGLRVSICSHFAFLYADQLAGDL